MKETTTTDVIIENWIGVGGCTYKMMVTEWMGWCAHRERPPPVADGYQINRSQSIPVHTNTQSQTGGQEKLMIKTEIRIAHQLFVTHQQQKQPPPAIASGHFGLTPRILFICWFWRVIVSLIVVTRGFIRSSWSFCRRNSSPIPEARPFRRAMPSDICAKFSSNSLLWVDCGILFWNQKEMQLD